MRFSLRTLLLLFPALIVSYGLAYFVSGEIYWHTGNHGYWRRENYQIRQLHAYANNPGPNFQYSKRQLFAWLKSALPSAQNSTGIQQALNHMETNDCWGNPYRCICHDQQNVKVDESQVVEIGIYSVGADGVSLTDGNDPDDLNSWSFDDTHYRKQLADQELWERRINALWLMPVIAVVVVIFWGLASFVWLLFRGARSFEWERSRNRR